MRPCIFLLITCLALPGLAGVRLEHSTTKVCKGVPDMSRGLSEIHIEAARAEYEGFQLVIEAGTEAMTGLTVQLTDLQGPGDATLDAANATLYLEYYHAIDKASECEPLFSRCA